MHYSLAGLIAGMALIRVDASSKVRSVDSVDDLKPNPEQFGEPTSAQRNATLSGRRGKIPRRKRKALNAKQGG